MIAIIGIVAIISAVGGVVVPEIVKGTGSEISQEDVRHQDLVREIRGLKKNEKPNSANGH